MAGIRRTGRDYFPPKEELTSAEKSMREMGLELASLLRECNGGSVVVRAFVNPKGVVSYTGRLHANMKGAEAPREYLSIREVVNDG